jgi:hypothetical protein
MLRGALFTADEFLPKGTAMPDEATIHDALKKEKLELPDRPVIETIEGDYIDDSTGEVSLEVWVILSDSTRDEELTGESVVQIKSAISESLLKSGVDVFPYIRLVKRSDYEGDEELE